jgi:hypothetical protein
MTVRDAPRRRSIFRDGVDHSFFLLLTLRAGETERGTTRAQTHVPRDDVARGGRNHAYLLTGEPRPPRPRESVRPSPRAVAHPRRPVPWHDCAVALPERVQAQRRRWFVDARDDGRQMELSWHRERRLLVVSLWHGSGCRATFQMPVEDVPELLGVLSVVLGEALQDGETLVGPQGSHVLSKLRELLHRRDAEILQLSGPDVTEDDPPGG